MDRDGVIENPALALPEVACPLGVYYSTTMASISFTFAPFTSEGLEPLDKNNVFVDMNRNGVWDFRETPTAAWRTLGLLQQGETLTRDTYVACVQSADEKLREDGFIAEQVAADYVARARTADLQPKEAASASRQP